MAELKRTFFVVLVTDSKDDAKFIKNDVIQELLCCSTAWENIQLWELYADGKTAISTEYLGDFKEYLGELNGKTDDDKDERE